MTVAKKGKKVLGRGLSALISAAPVPVFHELETKSDSDVKYLELSLIDRNPLQPRQDFNPEDLKELSESISVHGILQPILVRPRGDKYQVVAGERRWRAAKLANLIQVPVIIKELSEKETAEIALVENVQRADLNPVETALAYQRLIDDFDLSQQSVAERVGKERASVANTLRILKLPADLIELVRTSKLSAGHAKAILAVKEPGAQRNLAKKVIEENLSVRALESIVARVVVIPQNNKVKKVRRASYPEIENRLRECLGTKVVIKQGSGKQGLIQVAYYSTEELERLVDMITE